MQNPTASPQYVVDGIGLSPRWIRVTLAEARQYANTGYRLLDGRTSEEIDVQTLPAVATVNPAPPDTTAHGGLGSAGQVIVDTETMLSVAGDPQYLATQQIRTYMAVK
jgi:hypothetical protein